ncbi:hypothetical protein NC653_041365 [Populus alba x Populus x berolinensis]|uniref:Uncharacterized protein n=1 Tax=Populus alba x Populus x berolinensis TaxID=444605 RepID=A0AAD6L8C6_9ROSI|nr:hypothetical protein NC653_041365 [Populus alba x Populus x berolinensis]
MGRRSTMPPAKPPPLITVHHPSRRSQCGLSLPPAVHISGIEACDSSQDSGTECPELEPHHIQFLNPITCLESKMDSLRTVSANSSTDIANSVGNSPISDPPDKLQSPSPSPQTVRKKKGGKKKKEAKGR